MSKHVEHIVGNHPQALIRHVKQIINHENQKISHESQHIASCFTRFVGFSTHFSTFLVSEGLEQGDWSMDNLSSTHGLTMLYP